MELIIPSLIAGFLNILAPCMLPVLPVILSGSVSGERKKRPWVIIISLGISILLFTIFVRSLAGSFGLPSSVWTTVSAVILILMGLIWLWPEIWEKFSFSLGLYKAENLIQSSNKFEGVFGEIILGASLGPVFSSCSPTFSLILAIILPVSFWQGAILTAVFVIGFMAPLFAFAVGGRKVGLLLKKSADPKGWFKRITGVVLILLGVGIYFGLDKKLEKAIVDSGGMDWSINLEKNLIDYYDSQRTNSN